MHEIRTNYQKKKKIEYLRTDHPIIENGSGNMSQFLKSVEHVSASHIRVDCDQLGNEKKKRKF